MNLSPNQNHHETNPYLLKLNQIEEARTKWDQSEWLLNHLRTQGSTAPKQLTDKELLTWIHQQH